MSKSKRLHQYQEFTRFRSDFMSPKVLRIFNTSVTKSVLFQRDNFMDMTSNMCIDDYLERISVKPTHLSIH